MKRTWVLRTPEVVANALGAIAEATDPDSSTYDGKVYRLTLEPYRKPRTLPQNNTLHMWIQEIAEQSGHSPGEVNDVIKGQFYPTKESFSFGVYRVIQKSTTELDIREMGDVMTQVHAWAIDFGWHLTDPDPAHIETHSRESAQDARQ